MVLPNNIKNHIIYFHRRKEGIASSFLGGRMEMKPFSFFGILTWSILTCQSYSMPEAREAKSFATFNPFPYYQNSVGSYGGQIHGDPLVDSLIRHSSYPPSHGGYERDYYSILKYAVGDLIHEVKELERHKSECIALMPSGSKVIGSVCYYVEPTPATFEDALEKCRSYGGTLAEPFPQFSNPLWSALIANFPSQMASILAGGKQAWIGATADTNDNTFRWISIGTEVFPTADFDPSLPMPPPTYSRGALMKAPGMPWNAEPQTNLNPYVCWSTPL